MLKSIPPDSIPQAPSFEGKGIQKTVIDLVSDLTTIVKDSVLIGDAARREHVASLIVKISEHFPKQANVNDLTSTTLGILNNFLTYEFYSDNDPNQKLSLLAAAKLSQTQKDDTLLIQALTNLTHHEAASIFVLEGLSVQAQDLPN